MARAPAAWAEPSLGAALAGHSARAPCPHPASQSQPSPGRLPARRSRSQSAMLHREANGRVPLVAASRTEIGSRRSSDAAARRRSSRWRGGAAAGRAACRFAGEAAPLRRRRSRPRGLLRRLRRLLRRPRGRARAPCCCAACLPSAATPPRQLRLRANYGRSLPIPIAYWQTSELLSLLTSAVFFRKRQHRSVRVKFKAST